jgi:hypothetical protein
MAAKKSILFFVSFIVGIANSFSQTYIQPNYALKSHETLEILKAEITGEKTVLYLAVENRINGGAFCADKNIFIVYPDGSKLKMINSSGIPECPDTYKFKTIGEKLRFTLTFPPLNPGTKWIDLIEDCNSNCFSFYGITLDIDLNKRLDEAFSFADKGENYKAISLLSVILEGIDNENAGIEGALYSDIIALMLKTGDRAGAEALYQKMLSSKAPRLDLYIKNLNSRGLKF